MLNEGPTTFTIPVVPCAEAALFGEIVGFTRIQIDSVVTAGTLKGITLHALWEE